MAHGDGTEKIEEPIGVPRQLTARPLFGGTGPYGLIVAPVVLLFSWMMVTDWDSNAPKQKLAIGIIVAFMWFVALALLVPRRVRWAPRILTLLVGLAFAAYVWSEARFAWSHRSLSGSGEATSLPKALLGFLLFGVPSLYYAWRGHCPWKRAIENPRDAGSADNAF